MRRKILIVEDEKLTLEMLSRSLIDCGYSVVTARNGEEAIRILRVEDDLAAILLDIFMPIMDGYEVLRIRHDDEKMREIPVIVQTIDQECEIKALTLGANDYIVKPFDIEILKCRLANIIQLRESASIINAIRVDSLTGLLSRGAFYDTVEEMVLNHKPGHYVLSCFDIEKFKVVNDLYGTQIGDEVLRAIGHHFTDYFSQIDGICCRINADNFAILYPASLMDSSEVEEVLERATRITSLLKTLTFSIGRYIVEDKSLSASAMYDRAMIAKATIKGRYDVHVAQYDESMRKRILSEQEIVSEMKSALAERQFEVWYQPQYNHEDGTLVGAEALVRWRHPERGLISPCAFIPIFEQNGFVYEIDKYVWEQSCIFLREQLDQNKKVIPISVNISRYDIYQSGLFETVSRMIKRYHLEPDMLRLEITESAFAKSTEQIISVVEQFKNSGFIVEIDDFGSGYSSLNTLKDVPADVLKLDMKFLEDDKNSAKGGNIIASIVGMAKWIGMTVIAEGVETIQQANFLKSIGCCYIQGYLYSKPLPKAEYVELLMRDKTEVSTISMDKTESYDFDAFWSPSSMETLIFNSFVGGACIFEYQKGKMKLLRVNDKFIRIFGEGTLTESQIFSIDVFEYVSQEDKKKSEHCLQRAITTKDSVMDTLQFRNFLGTERILYIRSMLRVVAQTGERYLFYCVMEDITQLCIAEQQRKEAERRDLEYLTQIITILESISNGVTAYRVDSDGTSRCIYSNEFFYEIFGFTKEQAQIENFDVEKYILTEDYRNVRNAMRQLRVDCKPIKMDIKGKEKDGKMIYFEIEMHVVRMEKTNEEIVTVVVSKINK